MHAVKRNTTALWCISSSWFGMPCIICLYALCNHSGMQCRLCIARKALLNSDMLVQGRLCNCIAGAGVPIVLQKLLQLHYWSTLSCFAYIVNPLQHSIQTPSHTIMRGRIHRKFALIFLQIFPQIFAQIFLSPKICTNICKNICAKIFRPKIFCK